MAAKRLIELTDRELNALRACVSGELDNDDGGPDKYMAALRQVAKKLEAARYRS